MGWPPIRTFRKNSMATQPQKDDGDAEAKSSGCLYVKVSMEGAPYLRKVDLNSFSTYKELSSALEKMFSCFTISEFLSTCYHSLCVSPAFMNNHKYLSVMHANYSYNRTNGIHLDLMMSKSEAQVFECHRVNPVVNVRSALNGSINSLLKKCSLNN